MNVLMTRIDQLLQYIRWYETGKMERHQVEDLFGTILDEIKQ